MNTENLRKRVFVSGCYDMLHSGHVAFFKAAAQYGDLYVGIGSDATIEQLKNRKTVYSERERLYMVKAIRYVTDAYINPGSGMMDFVKTVDRVKPDIFVVNSDGGSDTKREFCRQRGIEYIELERVPDAGLEARSTTALRRDVHSHLPYRLDLAGTWIDQPYVSCHGAGWAITISLEPTVEFMERAGMSTSTRNAARKIWPYELPAYNEEMLARLLFCFENDPEREGHISGAQDAIGICVSGLCRHYYDNRYWPSREPSLPGSDVSAQTRYIGCRRQGYYAGKGEGIGCGCRPLLGSYFGVRPDFFCCGLSGFVRGSDSHVPCHDGRRSAGVYRGMAWQRIGLENGRCRWRWIFGIGGRVSAGRSGAGENQKINSVSNQLDLFYIKRRDTETHSSVTVCRKNAGERTRSSRLRRTREGK